MEKYKGERYQFIVSNTVTSALQYILKGYSENQISK